MKTAIDDKFLMPNLNLPITKTDFLHLLEENNVNVSIKEIAKREMIQFLHKIYIIEKGGYSIEGPTQQHKQVIIVPKFDDTGILRSQTIMFGRSELSSGFGVGYEILEPFLNSSEWKIIKKDTNPGIKGLEHRTGKYLLENESKKLVLQYDQGTFLTFASSQSREFMLNNKMFWNDWGSDVI